MTTLTASVTDATQNNGRKPHPLDADRRHSMAIRYYESAVNPGLCGPHLTAAYNEARAAGFSLVDGIVRYAPPTVAQQIEHLETCLKQQPNALASAKWPHEVERLATAIADTEYRIKKLRGEA